MDAAALARIKRMAEMFPRLGANNPDFVEWARAERADAIMVLSKNPDQVSILRAQGKVQILDTLLERMGKEVTTH